MIYSVVGLDIGQYSIKGVRLTKALQFPQALRGLCTLRGVRPLPGLRSFGAMWGLCVVDSFEKKISGEEIFPRYDGFSEAQIAALRELCSEGKIHPGDSVALAFPGHFISRRVMTFPFPDLQKLREVIPYGIEEHLPFGIDEVQVGYQFLHSEIHTAMPTASILVGGVPKVILRNSLEQLKAVGIDPVSIGLDASSFYAFYCDTVLEGREKKQEEVFDEALLVDIGATKTVLCHVRKGDLSQTRTLPMGGAMLTQAMQKEFGLTWDVAERLKREVGLVRKGGGEGQAKERACLGKAVSPLILEIEKSYRVFGGVSGGDLYLCGGGGALEGLEERLCLSLGLKAPDRERSAARGGGVNGVTRRDPLMAQGLGSALPLLKGGKSTPINFRQGEFAYGKERVERRGQFVAMGIGLWVVCLLLATDFYFHYRQKEGVYQALKGDLMRSFSQTFPQIKTVAKETEQAKREIAELNRVGAFLGMGGASPMGVLKVVTEGMPAGIPLDVVEWMMEGNRVRVMAQTNSFESVDRIRVALRGISHFESVSVGDAKVGADPSRIGFSIEITVLDHPSR